MSQIPIEHVRQIVADIDFLLLFFLYHSDAASSAMNAHAIRNHPEMFPDHNSATSSGNNEAQSNEEVETAPTRPARLSTTATDSLYMFAHRFPRDVAGESLKYAVAMFTHCDAQIRMVQNAERTFRPLLNNFILAEYETAVAAGPGAERLGSGGIALQA